MYIYLCGLRHWLPFYEWLILKSGKNNYDFDDAVFTT